MSISSSSPGSAACSDTMSTSSRANSPLLFSFIICRYSFLCRCFQIFSLVRLSWFLCFYQVKGQEHLFPNILFLLTRNLLSAHDIKSSAKYFLSTIFDPKWWNRRGLQACTLSVCHTSFLDFTWPCFQISSWKLWVSFHMKFYRSSSTFIRVDIFSRVIAHCSKFCFSF